MNRIFPSQYSTLSATALQDHLIENYLLDIATSCRLLIRNVSDTYILNNDKQKFIFKIYRNAHRKLSEIEAEVELLFFLKDQGNNFSFPIKDITGNMSNNLMQLKAPEMVFCFLMLRAVLSTI